MPVFGLLKEHYLGTYIVRPPSFPPGNPAGGYGLRSHTSHVFTSESKRSRARPYSACENLGTNVVIAAYGTQVTLHRCHSAKEDWCSKEIIPSQKCKKKIAPSFDVHIPTEHSFERSVMNASSAASDRKPKKQESLNITDFRSNPEVNDVETGENTRKFSILNIFEQSVSSCSSVKYTKQTNQRSSSAKASKNQSKTASCNSDKFCQGERMYPTDWQEKHEKNNQTVPSIANLVDLCEVNYLVTNSLKKEQRDEDKRQFIIVTPPNSETTESVGLYENNSFGLYENISGTKTSKASFDSDTVPTEALENYHNNSILSMSKTSSFEISNPSSHSMKFECNKTFSRSKIQEVWSNRHKKEIPTMRRFSHESLRRPSSASAALSFREECANKPATPLKKDESQTKDLIEEFKQRRRNTRRRKKTSIYSNSPIRGVLYEQNVSSKAQPASNNCSGDLMYTKSLIRQNHRPTTAIRYCQPDRRTACSITPCLRKAEVFHSVYTNMHNHVPILHEKLTDTNHGTAPSHFTKSNSRDLSVKARRLNVTGQKADISNVYGKKLEENEVFLGEMRRSDSKQELSIKICKNRDPIQGMKRCHIGKSGELPFHSKARQSSKDESTNEENDDAVTTKTTSIKPNECGPLRLLLEQIPENVYQTDYGVSETNKSDELSECKVDPLLETSIYALENESSDTDENSENRKNIMIKKWLSEVVSPISSEKQLPN